MILRLTILEKLVLKIVNHITGGSISSQDMGWVIPTVTPRHMSIGPWVESPRGLQPMETPTQVNLDKTKT
jgi:hypothetical protein